MRKLLLTSSALVAAASISSYAVADVSVTGGFEWRYTSTSSGIAATDGDGVETFNKFVFGADAIQQLIDAGITLGSGVKISGVFDGATIDTVCE